MLTTVETVSIDAIVPEGRSPTSESIVNATGWPVATLPASASGKPTFTTMCSRSSSVAKARDVVPLAELELEDDELEALLPPPPTVWPTVKFTAEIVPAAGDFSFVASTAFWASLTLRAAWLTAALAWATATASTVGDGFWAVAAGFLA